LASNFLKKIMLINDPKSISENYPFPLFWRACPYFSGGIKEEAKKKNEFLGTLLRDNLKYLLNNANRKK